MSTEYKKAPEVKVIADDLIEQYHRHLIGLPVYYVFHAQAKEEKGRTVLATASKQAGIMALLVRNMLPQHDFGSAKDAEFFLIDVAHDAWEKLSEIQRIALVDHELFHCVLDEKDNLGIVGHDVEEFSQIARRYGAWKPDLLHFARMLKEGVEQMSFAEDLDGVAA